MPVPLAHYSVPLNIGNLIKMKNCSQISSPVQTTFSRFLLCLAVPPTYRTKTSFQPPSDSCRIHGLYRIIRLLFPAPEPSLTHLQGLKSDFRPRGGRMATQPKGVGNFNASSLAWFLVDESVLGAVRCVLCGIVCCVGRICRG